jgi:hypothetical protein
VNVDQLRQDLFEKSQGMGDLPSPTRQLMEAHYRAVMGLR